MRRAMPARSTTKSSGVNRMSFSKTRLFWTFTLAALALLAVSSVPASAKNRMTGPQGHDYNAAATDTSRAAWAIAQLRGFIADDPDPTHEILARRMIIRAMFTLNSPPAQIIGLIDTTGRMLPNEPQIVIFYYAQLAQDV